MPDNVSKSSKPVKVGLIYAEWCGHCTAFKPEWNKKITPELEKQGIEIVDFDHSNGSNPKTAETHPKLTASGFPTIYKIEDGKDPKYFDGERSADEIIKWATAKPQQGGIGCGCNKNKKPYKLWNGGKKKSLKKKPKKTTKKLKRNKHKRTVRI